MLNSKVCIVGDFAVGKTSLCERFVNQHFSEDYLTTVGVKIDTKIVDRTDLKAPQKLVIWDVAGTDELSATEIAYLRGALGYLFVADGTRADTLKTALALNEHVESLYGRQARVLLLNKCDLTEHWELSEAEVRDSRGYFDATFVTSAKTGDSVQLAFEELAHYIDRQAVGS